VFLAKNKLKELHSVALKSEKSGYCSTTLSPLSIDEIIGIIMPDY